MKWQNFVDYIKGLGYDGPGDNYDLVVMWLKDNGHNPTTVKAKGETFTLKDLYSQRPGQALDVSYAMDASVLEEEIDRKVQERIDELESVHGAFGNGGAATKAHPHIKVRDRLEDDPCVGYRKFDELGFGEFLKDVWTHDQCVRQGRPTDSPKRLMKAQQVMTKVPTGLGELLDSEGGFLTPTEHRNELLKRVYDTGNVFPRARQIAMTSKTLDVPYVVESSRADGSRHGGVRGYWTEEAAAYTASQPAFGKLTLTANKLTALGYVTEELDEDSSGIVGALQLLGELFSEELAFKLDDAFYNGDGVGKPLGILQGPCFISLTRNVASSVTGEDVMDMWARMWSRSRANAVWFCNQDVEENLMRLSASTLTTATDQPFFASNLGYQGGNAGGLSSTFTIMGRPVIAVEQAPSLATVGDFVLADMTQYLHGMRRGITTAQSVHVRFVNDETAFKASLRADGQPWWQSALTPFSGSGNTLSPFIGLTTT